MRAGAPKKKIFDENALSGSIHSTYKLASLQTDQNPTLGHPNKQSMSKLENSSSQSQPYLFPAVSVFLTCTSPGNPSVSGCTRS